MGSEATHKLMAASQIWLYHPFLYGGVGGELSIIMTSTRSIGIVTTGLGGAGNTSRAHEKRCSSRQHDKDCHLHHFKSPPFYCSWPLVPLPGFMTIHYPYHHYQQHSYQKLSQEIPLPFREAIPRQLCSFFKHCLKSLWPPPFPRFKHVCCKFFWPTFKKVRKRLSRQNSTK